MATYTWIGNKGIFDPNDASQAVNWSPTGIPVDGDTIIVGAGGVLDILGGQLGTAMTIQSAGATFNFMAPGASNFEAASFQNLPLAPDSSSQIIGNSSGANVTVLNITTDYVTASKVLASAGQTQVNVLSGYYYNSSTFSSTGWMEADAGATLTISSGNPQDFKTPNAAGVSAQFINAGVIDANGGKVVIKRTSVLDPAVYSPLVGVVYLQNGGTVETSVSYATSGPGFAPLYLFDPASTGTLQIDNLAGFAGQILDFQPGDKIDLGAALAISKINFDKASGVLTLEDASNKVLGSLEFISGAGAHASGLFILSGGAADGFAFSAGSNGHTVLTAATGAVLETSGTTGTWQSAGSWQSGAVPGPTDDAMFTGFPGPGYTLTTGGAPVMVGGLNELGSTLEVTSNTIVGPSELFATGATIDITSGNTLTAVELFASGSNVSVDPAAMLNLTGRPTVSQTAVNGVLTVDSVDRIGAVLSGTTLLVGGQVNAAVHVGIDVDQGSIVDLSGGSISVGNLVVASAASISGTGGLTIFGTLTDAGAIGLTGGSLAAGNMVVASGGSLSTTANVTISVNLTDAGSIALGSNAILEIGGTESGAGTIAFQAGASATVTMDGASGPASAISGFYGANTLDLAGLKWSVILGGATINANYTPLWTSNGTGGGTLAIMTGASVAATVQLAGYYATSDFHLSVDGGNGVRITTTNTGFPAQPTIALAHDTGASGTDRITSDPTLALAGVEQGVTVQYSLNGGTSWTSTFSPVQGANTVEVRQIDGASNMSPASSPFAFTLDSVAPTLAITSAGSLTTQASQAITGTIDATDAGLTVSIFDGTTLLGTVTPAAGGSWSKTITLPGLGFHSLTAQATDAAGNTGTGNPVVFITVPSLASPVLSLTAAQLAAAAPVLAGVATPYTVVLTDTQANLAANAGSVQTLIASGHAQSITHTGITGQGYSSYEDDYQGSSYDGSRYFFTGITGQPYTAYEADLDFSGHLTRYLFTGVSGQAYSAYEYDYASNGALAGSKYFYTDVVGQPYTGYEFDVDPQNRVTRYAFTGVIGQAYSAYEYDYDAGTLAGSRYLFTNVTGQAYTGYEIDFDASNLVSRYAFTGVTGQAYGAYEYEYRAGFFAGSKYFFTNVTGQPYTGYELDLDTLNRVTKYAFTGVSGQAYSAYEYDYAGGLLTGSKYFFTNVTGQPYTGIEIDLDAQNQVTKYAFTGVSGQAYTAYEYDYANGALAGSRYYFSNVVGQAYSGYEVDLDAANQVTRQVFTGVSGQPYSAFEYDYAGGVLTGSRYQFTGVVGQAYSSYETDLDASSGLAMQTLNNIDGSHRIVGFEDHLTIGSIANDTITGGGAGETFVFKPGFAQDTITDFAAHLSGTGHDTIQFATSQFADAAALMAHAANVNGNAVISPTNGDQLTLLGVTVAQLAANPGDFRFA